MRKRVNFFLLLLLACFASYIRFRFNSAGNFLLNGADGPYYPIQVRSLLEQGHLAFTDMPFVFYLEAFFAKVAMLFHVGSQEYCIIEVLKWTDILLPPLALVPVYFTAKLLAPKQGKANIEPWIVFAFSILSHAPLIDFMMSGLQKNAIAVIWMFAFFYYTIKWLRTGQKTDAYWIVFYLTACAFTHFGCFTLLLLFVLIMGFGWFFTSKQSVFSTEHRSVLKLFIVFPFLLLLLFVFDETRFFRLADVPLSAFKTPMLLHNLQGQFVDVSANFDTFLKVILVFLALWIYWPHRKTAQPNHNLLVGALTVFILFLLCPLLSVGLVRRLNPMAYVPITVLYLVVLGYANSKWIKWLGLLLLFMLSAKSVLEGLFTHRAKNITENAFNGLKEISDFLPKPSDQVQIISRQDLSLLSNWTLRTKFCLPYLFEKKDIKKHAAVYILRQVDGMLMDTVRFKPMPIPQNTPLVFKNAYFELYQLNDSTVWEANTGKTPKSSGIIVNVHEDYITVKNKSGVLTVVYYDDQTAILHPKGSVHLAIGMQVEAYGEYMILSTGIKASSIVATE